MSILNGILEAAKNAKAYTRDGFRRLIENWWSVAKIDSEHKDLVMSIARKIRDNKPRYQVVSKLTGVPWFFIGVIHQKECSLNFSKVLHNGELLSNVNARGTVLVPKGRGKGKNWTWEEAAVDALFYDKMHEKDLSTIPKMIDAAERYNGLGYRSRGIPSIYCWSHTNISTERGKYISDGKWDSDAPSKNPGVAAMFLGLLALGEKFGADSEDAPPATEIDKVADKTAEALIQMATSVGLQAPMLRLIEKAKTIDFNKGPNFWAVIDFSLHSSKPRLFIFDVKGMVWKRYLVAHGSGSEGSLDDGFADIFSNVSGSHASSLGIYQAKETYSGKHGLSLRLNGLEASNSNARSRAIVIHGADYVSDAYIKKYGRIGRSQGCPAVDMKYYQEVINNLKDGSLIIAWTNKV